MVCRLIRRLRHSSSVVLLPGLTLVALGLLPVAHADSASGRAQPKPAVDVIAHYPGASAEEVERQVAIPLEVALAGIPGLDKVWSKSLSGLGHVRLQFRAGTKSSAARQEVINRLQFVTGLPQAVTPQIAPEALPSALVCYTLTNPKDPQGRPVFTLDDLRALQDWTLEREFRRVPGVADVRSYGGAVKRYEIQPDPDQLTRYGITLQQLQTAIVNSNANIGGHLQHGDIALNVRGLGLIGGGRDPMQSREVQAAKDPQAAAAHLRAEEERRLREIRRTVIATVNKMPIHVEAVVVGGPLRPDEQAGQQGVVVSHAERLNQVGLSRPRVDDQGRLGRDKDGRLVWTEEDEIVLASIRVRPDIDSAAIVRAVRAKVKELNDTPSRLLPGVRLEPLPEPEREGCLWIGADFPVNMARAAAADRVRTARTILRSYPEVDLIVSQLGRPEDGTIPAGSNHVEFMVPLKPHKDWPSELGRSRPRTVPELVQDFKDELDRKLIGVDWSISTVHRDPLLEAVMPAEGEHLVKITGPDLDELERLADRLKTALRTIQGIEKIRSSRLMGRPSLELPIDRKKCASQGISVADLQTVIQLAIGGKPITQMIEGEKTFDVVLRWPPPLRQSEAAILNLPVDAPGDGMRPRLRLRDLVTPLADDGKPNPKGEFVRRGAAAIYRENGRRLIAVKFGVRERKSADVLAEIQKATAARVKDPYRIEWDNE
jgi:Cu/Ag efflux pump CusA